MDDAAYEALMGRLAEAYPEQFSSSRLSDAALSRPQIDEGIPVSFSPSRGNISPMASGAMSVMPSATGRASVPAFGGELSVQGGYLPIRGAPPMTHHGFSFEKRFAHGGEVEAALHAVRHHLAGGGFLSDLFSGPDYLSTGEVASPTNWGDPESAADFFKADRALRLAREVQAADDVTGSIPQPLRRPAPEVAPRQQVAAPAPAPAPATRRIETLPGDTVEPHDFPPVLERTIGPYDFGQAVSGQQVTTQMLPHFRERPGFGQVLLNNKTNWADAQPEVPTSNPQKYTLPEAAPPAPQAEINNAVSLARETIPSAAEALAAVENLHNAGVYSGEALDKAGEILAAHNRAMFDNVPVEEALRLIRAEGPRMVNQGMPETGGTTRDIVPLSYAETPAPAPAQAAINQATSKLTARAPQGPDLNDRQRDLIIRTIAAETSGKTPEESQAIAHVILNRIASGKYGATPEAVLFAKKQFEPWSNPNGANYPMRFSPESRRYGLGQTALDAALGAEDITKGATNFWAPKAQAALGRRPPKWGRTGGVDIGETRFHNLSRAEGGLVDDALHVVREHHADGEAVGPVATDNSERVRAAESAANLAKQIQAYEASMASIRQQPQDIQSMTHAPEKPRAPISVEALGKNREFGSAPYDVAGPLSTLAQGAYDMKTAPLYAFPPTAPLGMAIDTAEGVASGSPTQVALGALGGPLKVARNVIAPLAVATGVTAPDEAEAGSLERAMRAIRAYHGSPHKFDRFDLSKIGTGEGNQSYGHGLYFAENENVAKGYRDQLSGHHIGDVLIGEEKLPNWASRDVINAYKKMGYDNDTAVMAAHFLREHKGDINAASGATWSNPNIPDTVAEALLRTEYATPKGHIYEVGIHADPERLLNWDKPFREQTAPVKEAVRYAFGPQPLDARIGSSTMDRPGPIHSRLLNEAGVPGIKYLDAGSRGITGDPTHNYVIFNDKLIDINRRYAQGGDVEPASVEDRALMLVSKQA
jgi:hypothetical protein